MFSRENMMQTSHPTNTCTDAGFAVAIELVKKIKNPYHFTDPVFNSSLIKRGVARRPTRLGAKPAATAKVERKVSVAVFMVIVLLSLLFSWSVRCSCSMCEVVSGGAGRWMIF